MKIASEMTIATAENALTEIAGSVTDIKLTIPARTKHQAAGGEAAMVQMLLTWAQAQRQLVSFNTYAKNALDTNLSEFPRRLAGLAVVLLANKISAQNGDDVTDFLYQTALARLRQIQSGDPSKSSRGPQIEIVCADHLSMSAPQMLYNLDDEGVPSLSGRSSFLELARLIVKTTMPGVSISRAEVSAIGGTLYELFRNTEEHARYNERGDRIKLSLRGIQAKLHAMNHKALQDIVSGSKPLKAYASKLETMPNSSARAKLAEISVFDSGPGFAAKWLGKPLSEISTDEELHAIQNCFAKHASSKSISSAGLGLPHVVEILRRRGGFLRLRTGKQSLYYDFLNSADNVFGTFPALKFWRPELPTHSPAVGSLLTILIPIGLEQ